MKKSCSARGCGRTATISSRPTRTWCCIFTRGRDAPKFWQDVGDYKASQGAALKKVRYLLGMEEHPPPGLSTTHGMGTARSLAQYWEFAGVDVDAQTTRSADLFC